MSSQDTIKNRAIQAEALPFAIAAAAFPPQNRAVLQEQRIRHRLYEAGMYDPKANVLLTPSAQPGMNNE